MKAVLAACVFLSSFATSAFAQNHSVDDLARRTVERRAVEAMIWGMPVVNTDLMYPQMLKPAVRVRSPVGAPDDKVGRTDVHRYV